MVAVRPHSRSSSAECGYQRAAVTQRGEHARRQAYQSTGQLLPHALRHQGRRLRHIRPSRASKPWFPAPRRNRTRGKPCQPQDTHRSSTNAGDTWRSSRAQQVGAAVERVDDVAVFGQRHGIDGQVARCARSSSSVTSGAAWKWKAVIAGRGFALGARQCIFFLGLRVQEYRKILPTGRKPWPASALAYR